MLYFILIIIVLTLFLYYLYKDYLTVLKISSIVTISSGILTFAVGYLIKYFINANFSFIRISDITDIIVSRFVLNAIRLLILGLIEYVIYFIIEYGTSKREVKQNN